MAVRTGDPLSIPADTWNRLVALLGTQSARGGKTAVKPALQLNSGVIAVRNAVSSSGEQIPAYRAYKLAALTVLPDPAPEIFPGRIIFDVELPDDVPGMWCVVQEPLEDGVIGEAVVSGITVAWIDVIGETHTNVETVADSDILNSSTSGLGQILWVAGGVGTATETGEQWAVIRLGGGDRGIFPMKTLGTPVQDGTNKRWKYYGAEVEKTVVGYGAGWTAVEGGREATGDASDDEIWIYNTTENSNGASGAYGNGVNSANLLGFDIKPIPVNTVVWVRTVNVGDVVEYWVVGYENGVDGTCA